MISKIKPEELAILQVLSHPISCVEVMFHDFDSLGVWNKEKFGKVRLYQYPMMSFDSLFLYDPKLSKEKNWEVKNNLGEAYNLGGRLTGKSRIAIILDWIVGVWNQVFKWGMISSYDKQHVEEIFDTSIHAYDNHKILKILNCKSLKSPIYKLNFCTGIKLESVNMNITCFDDKTEILTNNGWKKYNTILKTDKVLSLNKETDIADYYPISKIYKYNYNGNVFKVNLKNSSFIFTPNHKIYYNWSFKQNWQIKEIKTLNLKANSQIFFKHSFIWKGKEELNPISFKVRKNNKSFADKKIDFNLWLEFLGWFVSEGHVSQNNTVYITQHQNVNREKCFEIEKLLKKMGLNYCFVKQKQYKIYCADLAIYLKNNCYLGNYIRVKSIYNSHNKIVPTYIKSLSPNQITIFLEAYRKGDGNILKNKFTRYNTVSEHLANDICELILKTGKGVNLAKNKLGVYCITELISKTRNILIKNIKEVLYTGKVWCVETNPHNLIFIRREGKCCWTGNSKNPGGQFFGKHCDRHGMEEASYLTKEVAGKMLMSQAETGCINRYSGMTTFTKTSPMGEIFFDLKNKKKIINLPSYVNSTWNDKKEADAIKEFGGKDSPGYKVQIEGKVFEGVESVFDIQRVRETYITDKKGDAITIKTFEVNKESFHRFKEIVIIEKPVNADSIGFYFDVGEGGAPSEYIIISKLGNIFTYNYRITTFQLSPTEEEEFIDFLIEKLSPNVIGLDRTSGVGKSLYSHLIKNYPEAKIVPVSFNENIEIGFAKDKDGKPKKDLKGNLELEEANMVDWSIQCLKDIFYSKKIRCYEDIKLDTQINNVTVARTKQGKVLYGYIGANHLFQAFQVFGICYWLTEGLPSLKPIKKRKPGMGSFGSA